MIQTSEIEMKYDNGGRRLGLDRRQFTYAAYLPERRLGDERRASVDRRNLAMFKPLTRAERRAIFCRA